MPEYGNNNPFQEFKNDIDNHSKDHTFEFDPADIRANNTIAAASYISFLFILPLVLRPDSRYARFHANQGLILFICSMIVKYLPKGLKLLQVVPIVPTLLSMVLSLVLFVYFLLGFINAITGKAKELPFIGGIKIIK